LHRLWGRVLAPEEAPPPALPLPMVNMISGGLHAGGNLDFQDFLIVPIGARTYRRALEMSADVYRCLGAVLREGGEEASLVGDGGGYGRRLRSGAHAAKRLLEACAFGGLEPGRDVAIALDVAASRLLDPATGLYRLPREGVTHDTAGMVAMLA